MTDEQKKAVHKLSADHTIAQIFKRRRRDLKLSLADVEVATRIGERYLELIEAGDYSQLRDDIYTKGYIKNYAEFLGLDPKPILELYKVERQAGKIVKKDQVKSKIKLGLKPIHSPKFIITPRTFLALATLLLFAVVTGYIIWQVSVLSLPPKLSVDGSPEEVSTSFAYVSGRVDGGADLSINDSPILTSPDGSFREKILLSDGPNQIKISARNKLGKTMTIDKTIVARLDKPSTIASTSPAQTTSPGAVTPPAKFDGVKLNIRANKAATWLIVEADGKEIFRGTMLAGTGQDFSAAGVIRLTVGNAGAAQLTLTNAVVTNKDLGTIGADGEVKRDLEFKKDTVVK